MAKRKRNPDTNTLLLAAAAIGGVYFLFGRSSKSAEAVKVYQQRMRQTYTTLKDFYFPKMPDFFVETGILDPGPDNGKWSTETEKASKPFIKLWKAAYQYASEDPDAAAAMQDPSVLPFTLLFADGTDTSEDAIVAKVAAFNAAKKFITKGDWWALYNATGITWKRAGVPPWHFSDIR
jgi:hypothetical protein